MCVCVVVRVIRVELSRVSRALCKAINARARHFAAAELIVIVQPVRARTTEDPHVSEQSRNPSVRVCI